MIRVGPLSRARVRAACYALRVRWVEELERQRDEAVRDRGQLREAFTLVYGLKETVEAQHQLAVAQRDGARAHASHWRREIAELLEVQAEGMTDGELLGGLKARFGGGGPGTVLDAWRQVCRLIDDREGFLSPASIVDRVALLIARQTADELPREAYDPAMGGDIEPPPGRSAPGACGATPTVDDRPVCCGGPQRYECARGRFAVEQGPVVGCTCAACRAGEEVPF